MAKPVTIKLQDNGKIDLAASATGVQFSTGTSARFLEALTKNLPFSEPEVVAEGNLTTEGDREVVLDGGAGKVSFQGSASAGASLGVFFDPAELTRSLEKSIGEGADVQPGLPAELTGVLTSSFGTPPLDQELLLALRWGYGIGAEAGGKLALSAAASASFGLEGRGSGLFAVCRRLPRDTGARDATHDLLSNWMLPRQVSAASDLAPGTWLIAQVDGGLAFEIGAQVGYDFSWVRGIELGEISGDIGLKIALGAAATLGFDVSGRYAIVVARESTDPASEKLRVRLYKLSKRGWSFGFDLGVQVTGSTPKPDLDELIQGVFGIHSAQLLEDLNRFTDPQKSLEQLLAGKAGSYLRDFFEEVTGLDVSASLAAANTRLRDLLARWNELDAEVAAKIWSKLDDVQAIAEIRQLAAAIVAAPDLRSLIAERLAESGFLATAGADWLETLAPKGLLELLDSVDDVEQRIQDAAQKTLDVLDEATMEATVTRLKSYLAQRFGVGKVVKALESAIGATDPGQLDAWVTRKLELFFEQALDRLDPDLDRKLERIRDTIAAVRTKGEELWTKTLDALNRSYSAQLAYRYQSSTSGEALFDVEIDFAADATSAQSALGSILGGKLGKLLVDPGPAVTVRAGTLAFGLSRRASIDLSLPGSKTTITRLTTAAGKVTAAEDDGRVLLYEATGDDLLDVATARARRISRLGVAIALPVPVRGGLRIHDDASLRFSYSLDEAVTGLTAEHFREQYRPWVEKFLSGAFPTDTGGPASGSFADWVSSLDHASDAAGWGVGLFGNTLSSLEVSLASRVGAAWLAGITTGGDEALRKMSRAIQKALRMLIPFYYLQDARRYENQDAEPLLLYACIPPMTAFQVGSNGVLEPKAKGDLYWWDFQDSTTFERLVFSSTTIQGLTRLTLDVSRLLEQVPGMEQTAAKFRDVTGRVNAIQQTVAYTNQRVNLVNLLRMESNVIHTMEDAAKELARFQDSAASDPEKAVEALTRLGANLANAFGKKLWTVYGKRALRPLGTLVFLEAARAVSMSLPEPDALLRVTIVKPGVQFPPAGFPEQVDLRPEEIAVRQAVASITG